MYFLNEEKNPVNLMEIFKYPDSKKHYVTVLEYFKADSVDIFCQQLSIYETTVEDSVAKINIGKRGSIVLPISWYILAGDREHGTLEPIPVAELIDREIETVVMKPFDSFCCIWEPIFVEKVYEEFVSISPKIRNTQFLAYPIETVHNPHCVFVSNSDVKQNIKINIYYLL